MTCIICIPNNREDIIMAMQSATALATHLGWDVEDVKDTRYQPTRYKAAIFVIGDEYMTVCKVGKKPVKFELEWHPVESWITEKYNYLVFVTKQE